MGESINLVAIKSVMTDPQIVQESSKETKTKKNEKQNHHHHVIWLEPSGVYIQRKWNQLCWFECEMSPTVSGTWTLGPQLAVLFVEVSGISLAGGLHWGLAWRLKVLHHARSLCFPPRVEDVSSPPPAAKSGTCCLASQSICTLIPLQSKSK